VKDLKKHWYLFVLLPFALVINENVVQWSLAVKVGGQTITEGFQDAFKHFTILGYLFFTAFRMVPYAGLALVLFILSQTKWKDYVGPVLIGGLIGILAMILWGSWVAQRPYFTDEHVSSTTAIAFVFIPMYAVGTGTTGAILLAGLYTPIRLVLKKGKTKPKDGSEQEPIDILD